MRTVDEMLQCLLEGTKCITELHTSQGMTAPLKPLQKPGTSKSKNPKCLPSYFKQISHFVSRNISHTISRLSAVCEAALFLGRFRGADYEYDQQTKDK